MRSNPSLTLGMLINCKKMGLKRSLKTTLHFLDHFLLTESLKALLFLHLMLIIDIFRRAKHCMVWRDFIKLPQTSYTEELSLFIFIYIYRRDNIDASILEILCYIYVLGNLGKLFNSLVICYFRLEFPFDIYMYIFC